MALALSDDHDAQERAWFEGQPWDRTPVALRRKLTAGEIEAAGNALVRFVGVDAYEAAGGVVRRDLFDDEQSRFLSDPALLQRLATEKLEALAGAVREEGWAWVEARIEIDSHALRQFAPCDHVLREPTPQEREELAALTRRSGELERQMQALEDAPEWSADEAECIDLEEQDMEPTAQGYLNHVPKAQIVQALKEAGPDLADDGVGAMKKDVLVVKAASRLAGKRWLPAPLRRPPG